MIDLPLLLWFALLVYCLVDAAQAESARVRLLPKAVWILLIVVFPFGGSIMWFVWGRPVAGAGRGRPSFGGRRSAPTAPDDDPDFLAGLARSNAQRERERRRRQQHDEAHDDRPEDSSDR
ncbi:MAG TPA: PLD nuclease N-terminal domain-containing protein [Cellulomonas sp.]